MQRVLDPAQIEAFATQRAIPRVRLPDPNSLFCARAARLRKLSEGHAIGDYLRLMASLADAQQRSLEKALDAETTNGQATWERRIARSEAHGMPLIQATAEHRDPVWHAVLHELSDTIAATEEFPAGVAAACRQVRQLSAQTLEGQADLLLASSGTGRAAGTVEARAAPFIMAALQVHWAKLVCSLSFDTVAEQINRTDIPGVCPVCGTAPVASIVCAEKAYQGYRYLHCALCATEWHMVRIKCSHCQSTEGIHYHSIEGGSSAVRAEACDVCRTYRKICYQEHDLAVEPLADDLGSLALDLLMTEAGFHRASGNPLLWQTG